MASTLPSNFSSDQQCYQNTTNFTPQDQVAQSNFNPVQYGFTMCLGQDDCVVPFSNNFGCSDDLLLSDNTNINDDNNNVSVDFSPYNSNSFMEVPSFRTSVFDYYNSLSNVCTNSPGSTYDELERNNVYNTLQNYVPTTNDHVATPPECWGFQGHMTQVTGSENSSTKVGRYSVEERKDRILRYLKKRNERNFRKTIKYACRKTLADRRVRIRGRFAKNQDEESPNNYDNHHPTSQNNGVALQFHNVNNQNEQCGVINEEWVQEAMASLLYMPSISSS